MVRPLSEKNVIYQIRQYRLKRRVYYYEEIDSTNTEAKRLCGQNKGAGALVVADAQTAGRGRLDRSFCSPKGTGIYLSAVYALDGSEKNLDLLSSLAGLAVRDTLYNMYNVQTSLKWPNDVLYEGKKLCGILCEIVNAGGKPKYVIVGVGLNLSRGAFPDDIDSIACTLADCCSDEVDRNELCVELTHNLDRYILRSRALQEDSKEVFDRLKACSASVGQLVRVILPDREFDARVLDLAPNGGLLVSSAEGEEVITAGEIIHIR